MYCGECGAKNDAKDAFCSECGAPLEQVVQEKKSSIKKANATKDRQPMSKKKKIIIGIVVAIIVVFGVLYKIGSDITSPKSIAKDYIQAVIDKDADRLYSYLEIEGDKTFVSKEVFRELVKNDESESNVVNYNITEVDYTDGELSAIVTFKYTTKNSSSELKGTVNLSKQKGKKFLFFDDWKISNLDSDVAIIEDYTIRVSKGATVTYAGVKLTDKYLDKEQTTSKVDVYVLPQVFTAETVIKSVLSNGMEIEETVTPSSYYNSHTVSFDVDSLTDSTKESIANKAKEYLTTIYTGAIDKKAFADIKSNFEYDGLDLTNLEKDYNEFVSDLEDAYNTLTSISFTDVTIYDGELDSDGNLEVDLKVSYDYSVQYTFWSDEVKTHDDSYSSYMTLIFSYNDGSYYIVGLDDLEDYFSRY